MQETYQKAIAKILEFEGGYTNNPSDPGGPTNWGITIHDAQAYWKADATAQDVKEMPRDVANNIYLEHYADPVGYNMLPAGVDFAVLDYAVNSGVVRALDTYHHGLFVDPVKTINFIYSERLHFLKTLHTWPTFGHGWTTRINDGRAFALSLVQTKPTTELLGTGDTFSNISNFITNLFKKGNNQS